MGDGESTCVEHLADDAVLPLCVTIRTAVAIGLVAEDGTSDGCEMDADLVHASRLESALYERVAVVDARCEDAVVSDGGLAFRVDADLVFTLGIFEAEEGRSDAPFGRFRRTDADGYVDFFHIMLAHVSGEGVEGGAGLRDHDDARGIAIEPMHERRPECK